MICIVHSLSWTSPSKGKGAMRLTLCEAPTRETRPDHNTGKCVGSLTSPASQYREDTGDGAYGLSSLSEKTRTSNHLQMSLQRQHILLSYLKTLSVSHPISFRIVLLLDFPVQNRGGHVISRDWFQDLSTKISQYTVQ